MLSSLNITKMIMKSGLNCDLIAFNVWKSHKANNKILRAWKVMMVLKCFELAELALLKMTFNEGAFLGNSTESILPLNLVGFFFSVTEKICNKKAWDGIFTFVFNLAVLRIHGYSLETLSVFLVGSGLFLQPYL